MKYFAAYLMAVIVWLPPVVSTKSEILVVLKHSTNSYNKKYVYKLLTPRKPINRTTSLTSTDVYLKPGVILDSPLYMHIQSFRKFATQYKPVLIKYKMELCEALKLKDNPFYKIFAHKTFETESNILNPCPLKDHIFIKPYYTSYERLPPLLPIGMWRIEITVTKGLEEKVFAFISYYEITATGLEEF